MSHLTKENIAYVAGLYEGDGTIIYTTTPLKKPYMRLTIAMSDWEPLEMAQAILGVGSLGKPISEQYHKDAFVRKPIYRYNIHGLEKVQYVIAMIYPWLSPRRKKQAKKVLERYKNAFSQRETKTLYVG